jgi:hypothetical protein
MLPMSVNIITADIEEGEEGDKASPIRHRRRPVLINLQTEQGSQSGTPR